MSKDIVLQGLKNKISELEENIKYETRKIEWLKKDIEEVGSGKKELKHVSF
jgi:cell division protein FtsL